MKPNLCVDAGNTRLKAALLHPATGDVLDHFAQEEGATDAVAALKNFLAGRPVRASILSAVTDERDALNTLLVETSAPRYTLDARLALPIANAYGTPGTLGADRVALACGAWAAHPGEDVLVISAGTCITYNFITRTRTFRGGAIAPGVAMRLRAMHHFTAALPDVELHGDTRLLGYDTETSLRSGAVLGAAAEVEGIAAQYAAQYPGVKTIFTGGDARLLTRHISQPLTHDPHILFKGLNAILNYHLPPVG